jgi:hypothetical protein
MARTRTKSIKVSVEAVIQDISTRVDRDKNVFNRVVLPEIKSLMREDGISFHEASTIIKNKRLKKASEGIIKRDLQLIK